MTPATLGLLVWSLCGCPRGAGDTPAPSQAETAPSVQTPPAPARTAAKPRPLERTRPADAPGAPVTGDPFRVPEEPRMPGMADRFVFWGWSADGVRYAFSTYNPGEGAVGCDMQHDVFVVDALEDDFVQGGHVQVGYDHPEGGPGGCTPPDLEARAQQARAQLLETHGVISGHLVAPVTLEPAYGVTYRAALPGGPAAFTFAVAHRPADAHSPAAQAGAAYRLTLATGGQQVIEDGARRRPGVVGYTPRFVFIAPTGPGAAVVLNREHAAFEGTRQSWMSNGFRLPAALR